MKSYDLQTIRRLPTGNLLASWQEVLRPGRLSRLATLTIVLVLPVAARAQDPEPDVQGHDHQSAASAETKWQWTNDANVFLGLNYQHRKFTDFTAVESQNWFMLYGDRPLGPGRLTLRSMVSFEAFTLNELGSPQVFQTGEMYHGGPLIDYQHPHDILMELGARYRMQGPLVGAEFEADLVGTPAIGPTPFMHRASARDNPQVPLTHHYVDSTHITTGVVRGGVGARGFMFDASVFRGEEPNENRLNIDRPRLNSWSARLGWRRGPWNLQMSGRGCTSPSRMIRST